MTVHRFYIRQHLAPNATGTLDDVQTRQARNVLRLQPGDKIVAFDGSGAEYLATLRGLDGREWPFQTGEASFPSREPSLRLTVGLSIIRNERFDLAAQKLTELGVDSIVPLAAQRSVITFRDARSWEKRRARLERIVVEAAEQSERTTLPLIHDPMSVCDLLDGVNGESTVALVEREQLVPIHSIVLSGRALLLVGPEGGWTREERSWMIERQVILATMGSLILRAETAAIAAAACLLLPRASEGARVN